MWFIFSVVVDVYILFKKPFFTFTVVPRRLMSSVPGGSGENLFYSVLCVGAFAGALAYVSASLFQAYVYEYLLYLMMWCGLVRRLTRPCLQMVLVLPNVLQRSRLAPSRSGNLNHGHQRVRAQSIASPA